MIDVYAFRGAPTYKAATPQELIDSAFEQPLSVTSTVFDQAKGGALESYGLGTAIRDFAIPDGETTPQNMVRSALRLANPITAPYEAARLSVQGFREDSPQLSEDAYKSSPYFRKNIPWDAGMTEARARALAEWDDAKRVREFYAEKRPISSFIGNLAGQALDPINYIPIAGPAVKAAAVARAGRVAGTAATGALDAAANTALFALGTRDVRGSYGDDVSWEATVSQIATAALIGSAFGAIGGAIEGRTGARQVARAEERLATLKTTQEARIALNEAIDAVVRGEDVRLSPNATEPLARVADEASRLGKAYDAVLRNPTGPVDDPLVRVAPGDIEEMIVSRGAYRDFNQVEYSKSGKGLVKAIWRHGEMSDQPAEYAVTKDDVVALPTIMREYEPVDVPIREGSDSPARTWRVKRNGRILVYGDKGYDGAQRLVTLHVQRPDRAGAELPLSKKKGPAAAGSSDEPFKPVGDTSSQSLPSPERGQPQLPATRNIARSSGVDNSTARREPQAIGIVEAQARAGKPDDARSMAEQYRVNPDTGEFPEMAEIDQLRIEGRLTEADTAELDAAQSAVDDASAYADVLQSVTRCLL